MLKAVFLVLLFPLVSWSQGLPDYNFHKDMLPLYSGSYPLSDCALDDKPNNFVFSIDEKSGLLTSPLLTKDLRKKDFLISISNNYTDVISSFVLIRESKTNNELQIDYSGYAEPHSAIVTHTAGSRSAQCHGNTKMKFFAIRGMLEKYINGRNSLMKCGPEGREMRLVFKDGIITTKGKKIELYAKVQEETINVNEPSYGGSANVEFSFVSTEKIKTVLEVSVGIDGKPALSRYSRSNLETGEAPLECNASYEFSPLR